MRENRYEQDASKERVGAYLRRWLWWAGITTIMWITTEMVSMEFRTELATAAEGKCYWDRITVKVSSLVHENCFCVMYDNTITMRDGRVSGYYSVKGECYNGKVSGSKGNPVIRVPVQNPGVYSFTWDDMGRGWRQDYREELRDR